MVRLKVLRSGEAVRQAVESINGGTAAKTSAKRRKAAATTSTYAANQGNSIDLLYLETYTDKKASENPEASTDHMGWLRPSVEPHIVETGSLPRLGAKVLEEEQIVADSVIQNNYADEVRGNVFMTEVADPFLIIPGIPYKGGLPHHTQEVQILASDAVKNQIENPFAGMELENGAAISMWMKLLSHDALDDKRGLVLFTGELTTRTHPDHPQGSSIQFQSYLSINCLGDMAFRDAYDNTKKTFTKEQEYGRRYRVGRNWEHVILSFTDNSVIMYLNGKIVESDIGYQGKRFGRDTVPSITNFISQRDTKLYLAVTVDNPGTFSDSILFDDIMFYDSAVTEQDAVALYEEALLINLP